MTIYVTYINFAQPTGRERELVALLSLSFWCLVIAVWLFLAVQRVCLQFVIVVFPDHTHLLFFLQILDSIWAVIAQMFCMLQPTIYN